MNERVPLSFLLAQNASEEPPVEPRIDRDHPLVVWLGEEPWVCTAVLERTVVLSSTGDKYKTKTARHDQVLVDPGVVEWRTRTSDENGRRLRQSPGTGLAHVHRQGSAWRRTGRATPDAAALKEARAQTDKEALANQREVKEAKEKEMRFLRQRSAQQAAEKEKEEVQATATGESIVSIPLGEQIVPAETYSGSPMRVPANAQKKVKLRHCHRCGEDKPKDQFKTKSGKGVCNDCRTLPEGIEVQVVEAAEGSVDKPKRKYTRRAKAGKRGGRRRKSDKATDNIGAKVTVTSTGHRNGRPSLTFKELIERIVGERDSLKARVDELEAERAQAFAQLQEVLG